MVSYCSSFFVTLCGFALAYGQYLLIFPTKWVFLFGKCSVLPRYLSVGMSWLT